MTTQDSLMSGNEPDQKKDTILGLSIRLQDGKIASGVKMLLTSFGFHVVNAGFLLILLIIIGINLGPALDGQYVQVAALIKSFGVLTFLMSFWFLFHQRILASTIYVTSIMVVYFILLQVLENSMYGSMAQLALLCFFQLSFLALITVIASLICQKKGVSPLSYFSEIL